MKSRISLEFGPVLHQTSASMLRQLYDDASDTAFIENNGVASKWVATSLWSDSIVSNESNIAGVILELMLTLGVNGTLMLSTKDISITRFT